MFNHIHSPDDVPAMFRRQQLIGCPHPASKVALLQAKPYKLQKMNIDVDEKYFITPFSKHQSIGPHAAAEVAYCPVTKLWKQRDTAGRILRALPGGVPDQQVV